MHSRKAFSYPPECKHINIHPYVSLNIPAQPTECIIATSRKHKDYGTKPQEQGLAGDTQN